MTVAAIPAGIVHAGNSQAGQPLGQDAHASSALGVTDVGLPGVVRLGLPGLRPVGLWTIAAAAGYGFTESQAGQTGQHHRFQGSFAAAFTAARGLDLGLRLSGRRDGHPSDEQGPDSGLSGEPSVLVRYGGWKGASALGAELGLRVPGREAPSLAFDAAVVDAKLQLGHAIGDLQLAALAGFRLDRSGRVQPDLTRLRRGDRLALGLSDFNAALVGLGASYRLDRTELLFELSADLLLGAPSVWQSPLRASGGVRQQLGGHWQVFTYIEAAAGARPPQGVSDPLIPVEPRVTVNAGLAYSFGTATRAQSVQASHVPQEPVASEKSEKPTPPASKQVPEPELAAEPEVQEAPVPAGQLRGLIRSFGGRGLAATVRVEPLGFEGQSGADGSFAFDIPPGSYTIHILAEGYAPQVRDVRIQENGVTILNADLRVMREAR